MPDGKHPSSLYQPVISWFIGIPARGRIGWQSGSKKATAFGAERGRRKILRSPRQQKPRSRRRESEPTGLAAIVSGSMPVEKLYTSFFAFRPVMDPPDRYNDLIRSCRLLIKSGLINLIFLRKSGIARVMDAVREPLSQGRRPVGKPYTFAVSRILLSRNPLSLKDGIANARLGT
jgi:hypothetical protein